jgi:hypothetical protein
MARLTDVQNATSDLIASATLAVETEPAGLAARHGPAARVGTLGSGLR